MFGLGKNKDNKKCPRCREKNLIAAKKCAGCGLVFSRMDRASNKEAKRALRKREKEKVIYVTKLPEDVNKWLLIVLTVLFGTFGAHCFYTGRWLRGTYICACMLVVYAVIIFQLDMIWEGYLYFMSFFSVFGGVAALMWLLDILNVSIGKFKVPVALKPEIYGNAETEIIKPDALEVQASVAETKATVLKPKFNSRQGNSKQKRKMKNSNNRENNVVVINSEKKSGGDADE